MLSIFILLYVLMGVTQTAWGPLIGALFYIFVNAYARSVGEAPADSWLLGWLLDWLLD